MIAQGSVLTSARMPVVTEHTMPYSNTSRRRPEAMPIFGSELQPAGIGDAKRFTDCYENPSVLLIYTAQEPRVANPTPLRASAEKSR